MKISNKTKQWLKKNWYKLLAGVVAVVAALLGIGLLQETAWRRRAQLKAKQMVLEDKGLEAELRHLEAKTKEATESASKADRQLELKQKELKEQIKKWDAKRIAEEFRRRGY